MTKTLVTGAAGFIGVHLVNALIERGDQVVCLARKRPQLPECFSHSQVTYVSGDVRDRSAVEQAINGVDRVFHLAAAVATKSLDTSREINVEGTRLIAEAAASQAEPPLLIYVSSLAAAGPGDRVACEADDCHPVSHYGRTKLEAESVLHAISARLPVTIVRPPCVIGPGDQNLLALYKTVIKGWNLVLSKEFRYSYISVEDLVPGMLLAAERGRRLRTSDDAERQGLYYLTDPQAVTFPELAEMIAETLGGSRRVRHLQIPRTLGWIVGGVGEVGLRCFGRRGFLNLDKIREGCGGSWVCDGQRARVELGFTPSKPLFERLQSTTESYQRSNRL